jgi:TolA-binding protein
MLYPLFLLATTSLMASQTLLPSRQAESIQELENKVEALEDVVLSLVAKLEQQEASMKAVDETLHIIQKKEEEVAKNVASYRNNEKRLNAGTSSKSLAVVAGDVSDLYGEMVGLVASKNYASAEKMATDIVAMKPKDSVLAMLYFWIGEIRMVYGDHVVAKDYYEKALALKKNHDKAPDISLKLAVIAYENGRTKEADGMVEELLKRFPKSTASHLARLQKKKYHAPRR